MQVTCIKEKPAVRSVANGKPNARGALALLRAQDLPAPIKGLEEP